MKTERFVLVFLSLFYLFEKTLSSLRMCKPSLLRSFGYFSLLTPNRQCSLCPNVALNCCTKHDQMSMHKNWANSSLRRLKNHYSDSVSGFRKLEEIFNIKSSLDLEVLTAKFKRLSFPKPQRHIIRHLRKIAKIYMANDAVYFLDIIRDLVSYDIPALYKKVMSVRKAMLCTVCDWHTHNLINIESMTITYHYEFCQELTNEFLNPLHEKYVKIYKILLLIDEWFFLTTHTHVMNSAEDRATYRKYILVLEKCRKNPKSINSCADFCREFNLNRFTYMFDGENEVVFKFIKKLYKVVKTMKRSQKKFFNKSRVRISKKNLKKFKKNNSVFSKRQITRGNRNSHKGFGLRFKSSPNQLFFEKKHQINSIQIETLDDELDSTTLFRLNDHPVDISNFLIIFHKFKGINLFKDERDTNISLPTKKLLALLHTKGSNV